MKKHYILILVGLISITSHSQCIEEDDATVLLVGDSWAFFMNADGTFDDVLEHWGHSNQSYFTNAALAVNGARTEDFLEEAKLNELENQLTSQPTLKAVHLSVSGNDFLGAWNVDDTPAELEALSDETFNEVIGLFDFIQSVRPDIRIVFSGYMYANFAEVIDDAAPFEESHPFYGSWEGMGFPTFEELNNLLNDFSQRIYDYSLVEENIDFVFMPAYMQYIYGQETPLGVDPGGTYAPYFQPLPFGDLSYPSPKESMRDYGLFRDCFHLSAGGFNAMIDYQFQKLYQKLLMDDAYLLSTIESEMGNISASGIMSSEVKFGNSDAEDIATVLSFNTTTIPDTLIVGANIFLRRENVIGAVPFETKVLLTMKHGNLGITADIEAEDFTDLGDIQAEACVFGVSADSSDWIRIDLPESFMPFIESGDYTQFSIKPIEIADKVIQFSDGSNPEFAPVFNLKFKQETAGINEMVMNDFDVVLYPNPANNVLNMRSSNFNYQKIEILNIQGQLVYSEQTKAKSVDVSRLETGHYILQLIGEEGVYTASFIKD
ncbi:T9SS type A sorting domain-containing protein [Crocinitomix sp.]|nr:T9SS type A sorting domain-containing protein [Crocinitomix sp.]